MKKLFALLLAMALLCAAALAETPDTSRIADASEMTDVEDIVPEGMTPVTADMLNDGVYEGLVVDSSSAMFKIIGCALTVENGGMTARLTMKSDAYSYMFPGTAQEASQAAFDTLVPLEPLDEGGAFTLPVDALDAGYTCAAFSARKQAWYPRTLLFRSDSLPLSAWKNLTTAESLGLADGDYPVEVALAGGGSVEAATPATLHVQNGQCTADLLFSSAKVDYVLVDGQRYDVVVTEGGAACTVPVAAFNVGMAIILDSTAISPAVEVPYTITFQPPEM